MLEREPWDPHLRYQSWVIRNTPTDADLTRERLAVKQWLDPPRLSVLTPVYNTPPEMLRRMIRSIQRQTYSNWELCLVDDGSPRHWTGRYLEGLAARDPRIRVLRRARNGGIVAASNDALALATGVFVVLCDDDDELDPRALTAVARQLREQPETDVIYSDFDVIGPHGLRYLPMFLPDWSPELLLSIPYIAHLAAYRREIVQRVGGFRPEYEGSQDYDLALRVTAITDRIAHIPRILYHWRTWSRSAAGNPEAKPYAYAAGIRAVTDHLPRRGFEGRRDPGDVLGCHAVRFAIKGEPLVSIVSRSQASLEAMWRCTAYARYECVSSAADARGDHLLFLGDDLEPRDPGWLGALLEFSQQPGVGVVGGKIYQRDDLIWHAGIVVPRATPHLVKLDDLITRNYSAVSGACLITRRDVFEAVGGFEPADRVGCVDIDYCLRAQAIGQRTVLTPHARLRHLTSAPSEPDAGQRRLFRDRWGQRLLVDPFYNRNFRQDAAWFVVGLNQSQT